MEVNRYIALFRGINVGGHNSLPMKDLVRILEELGCENVRTYIQSGNAVFDSAVSKKKLADAISSKVHESKGFQPKVLLLEVGDLEDVVRRNPYDTGVGKALHLYFMEAEPTKPDLRALDALKATSEEYTIGKGVFYLYAPEGIGRSKLAIVVEKRLGVPVTARNWNTVSKLLEMAKAR